ncbi:MULTISPECIES: hypothetical protein [unclassified Thioalkalivibrio]|uniref:hypothetical protein n=1 Tax=unclassified Thioalkalivibrio TaxID=2621013 RepID=UPI00037196E9|nr:MULTISPECIES: hypothetical protein [unclassified Thioalkalivibrio]
MKLITVDQFRQRYFDQESQPQRRTVRSWIDAGEVPGKIVGKLYYVDEDAWLAGTHDALVERVLQSA